MHNIYNIQYIYVCDFKAYFHLDFPYFKTLTAGHKCQFLLLLTILPFFDKLLFHAAKILAGNIDYS